MKTQLFAIVIAAVSGCAGFNGPNGFACASRTLIPCEGWTYTESDAHYAARMQSLDAFHARNHQPMPVMPVMPFQPEYQQPLQMNCTTTRSPFGGAMSYTTTNCR